MESRSRPAEDEALILAITVCVDAMTGPGR
jgi:hypothetical protein